MSTVDWEYWIMKDETHEVAKDEKGPLEKCKKQAREEVARVNKMQKATPSQREKIIDSGCGPAKEKATQSVQEHREKPDMSESEPDEEEL